MKKHRRKVDQFKYFAKLLLNHKIDRQDIGLYWQYLESGSRSIVPGIARTAYSLSFTK